ncbi:MAG TPA: response regulator transcription factor [Thermoanaerobaculia bacterium]|jgi:two-component system KDP operon response regulator KdpE|nr:response regulator transcription factor [Thermoanaerobaculia bacterium]
MTHAPRVLVVEDDPAIRRSIVAQLRAEGYDVVEAADGREALAVVRRDKPDLILTDLAMPVLDGFTLITTLRKTITTPIVVLSVRGGETDRVRALDLGADDFVSKPFSVAELLARVRAQLRRSGLAAVSRLRFAALTIDFDRRRVVRGEDEIRLTPTEFALLTLLATNAGKVVTTDQILARVWKDAPSTTADTVRVHVSSLRRKIEPDPSSPQLVVTEPWIGYRFIAEPLED